MHPCPAPNGARLPGPQRDFFGRLLRTLIEHQFRQSRLQPLLPGLVADFDTLAPTDADLQSWCDELGLWVRWYRVPAFWLSFFFQSYTQAQRRLAHFVACELHADAQTAFADDLALSSLEAAYTSCLRNAAALGPAFDPVRQALEGKLKLYLDSLATWARPFSFREANPIADHRWSALSWSWLVQAVADDGPPLRRDDAAALESVIDRADGDAQIHNRIVARRFLGLLHDGRGEHAHGVEQFRLALADARAQRMDSEIGHLRRLLGSALRSLGQLDEARHHFEQALAFERLEPFFNHTLYWQALSARELGDTLLRRAGPAVAIGAGQQAVVRPDVEQLKTARAAYHDGRLALGGHLSLQCPYPLARAAKQQLFRSYSNNAIQVAGLLQSPKDVLAEVEWAGPREATALVTEMAAAHDLDAAAGAGFRQHRALFFETLNTAPPRFEDYLHNVASHQAQRRAYLQQSIALGARQLRSQDVDGIVDRTLALRLPGVVFLMFHVGPTASTMVLLDLESATAAPFDLAFGEVQLRAIHAEFEHRSQAATDAASRNAALEGLLSRYESLLAPALEPLLRFLPGRHLKIFPRLQMNAVPLHALRLQGRPLIEHAATVSYGQTLGLFLANHDAPARPVDAALRFVIGDAVPWYELLLPTLRQRQGHDLCLEAQVGWAQLLASIAARPARDTVFACHGRFDPQSAAASELELAARPPDGRVSFSRVFEQLDLHGCRSVVMGSCESGLSRTEVAAEYLGLPAAMLSAGVRYVVGALWTIPQGPTAILVDRFVQAIASDDADLCAALCQVQRDIRQLSRRDLADWVRQALHGQPTLDDALQQVAALDEQPFAQPYHWAGLHVVGDV